MSNDQPVAVLDLGTNSTRFLMGDPGSAGFSPDRIIDRDSVVTRLGEGVDAGGLLNNKAIERVLDQVENYRIRVNDRGGTWVGAVATSACRRVENGDDLLDRIVSLLDIRPEIITGNREATLIFEGVNASLPEVTTGRVMDIGGGSTEWITFRDGEIVHLESKDVGVVTIRERFELSDRWTPSAVEEARKWVRQYLPTDSGLGSLIVVGGTGTTLSSYRQNLDEYDSDAVHGDRMTLSGIDTIRRDFISKTFSEMSDLPMIQSGREDVMIPGIVILEEFARACGVKDIIVSDFGILAGLIEEVSSVGTKP